MADQCSVCVFSALPMAMYVAGSIVIHRSSIAPWRGLWAQWSTIAANPIVISGVIHVGSEPLSCVIGVRLLYGRALFFRWRLATEPGIVLLVFKYL